MTMTVPSITLNSGRGIPAIGFGTGTSFFNRGEAVASLVGEAVKAGVTSFDTATIYGTEEGLGQGLAGLEQRSGLYLTTKTPDWSWTKAEVVEEVELSLKRLQVDVLDLVLLHTPAPRTKLHVMKKKLEDEPHRIIPDPQDAPAMKLARQSAWSGLETCVARGLVRDIGVSNFTPLHLQQILDSPGLKIRPAVNQVEFNPYQTDPTLLAFCREKNILLQAFGPLGNGREMLSNPVLVKIGQETGKTPAQVSLRWAYQMGVATVMKTERPERMKENIDIFDFTLNQQQMDSIKELNKNLRLFGDPSGFP